MKEEFFDSRIKYPIIFEETREERKRRLNKEAAKRYKEKKKALLDIRDLRIKHDFIENETKEERKKRLDRERGRKYRERKEQEVKDRKAQWYREHKEEIKEKTTSPEYRSKVNAQSKERYNSNKNHYRKKQREYYEKNKEKILENKRKYNEENKDKVLAWKKAEYEKNKKDYIHRANIRKYRKYNATPSWLTEEHWKEIEEIYNLSREMSTTGETRYDVDHIIPIQGKLVCGLHVPWNLQILERKQNRIKSNLHD